MTVREACGVLDARIGASLEEIEAAYRERARRHSPDLHGDGVVNLEVRQVPAAYDTLSKRDGAGQGEGTRGQADDAVGEDGPDPVRFVRAFLAESDVEILFDGSVR